MVNIIKGCFDDDVVDPDHYKGDAMQVIDAYKALYGVDDELSGCRFSIFQYLFRYDKKGTPIQDLRKIKWYVNRMIDILESKESD